MARTKKTIVPAELTAEIATTRDGRDITQRYVGELQQPRDPRLLGSIDWGVYDLILKDDQVKSCLEQRQAAVVSAPWDVLPGDDGDPRSCEAAAEFKQMIEKIGWDRITKKMLYAPLNGYSVGELIWKEPEKGKLASFSIKVRHARRFRYGKGGELRMLTRTSGPGEVMPDRKFWVVTAGGSDDDEPYGHGLADWLYWPALFKRNGIRFWNIFLDKFGTPTAIGKYRRGTPKSDIDKLADALQALATDSGIVVPEGFTVELLQAVKSGNGDFERICRYMDEAIAKILLSQTMTTQDGASLSQAQVHAGVKLELVKADADLLSDSFNTGPSRWWTDINYGADVAAPLLVRLVDEEADLKLLAETDAVLSTNGWERTDDSFKDTYGDGFTRKVATVSQDKGKGAQPYNDNVINLDKARVANFAEAPKMDSVDEVVAELLEAQDWQPLTPIMRSIIDAIEASASSSEIDEKLLAIADDAERQKTANILARAGFAVRIAAEAGEAD